MAPIRYVAPDGGVTLDAGGASAAIKIVSVGDVSFEGIVVTSATTQGVWVYGAQRVNLDGLSVRGNGGPGIQIRDSVAVTVSRSVITGNGGAGIFETTGCSDGRYVSNEITANGINGAPYSGDGIQIAGVGAHVARQRRSGAVRARDLRRGRHLVWNGARVTLSGWKGNGYDAHSLASTPPTFDSTMRIVSKNLGRKRGQDLGLVRDYAGTPVPPGTAPDIGAYQS